MDKEDKMITSPVPQKTKVYMTFCDALIQVAIGKRITKEEWGNEEYFGQLKDGFLMLHKPDGKFYQWIISEGDLIGTNWHIVPEAN